jgi:hypothetical protein
MADKENAVLEGTIRDLGEASRRIWAARYLMREHALEENPDYLPLVARLSEALDVTEAAHREARCLRLEGVLLRSRRTFACGIMGARKDRSRKGGEGAKPT